MNNNRFVGFKYEKNEMIAEKMKVFREQLMELGINSTGFDDDTDAEYDEDIKLARKCLYHGEEVPDDVRERLLERKSSLKVNKPRLLYRNIQDGRI